MIQHISLCGVITILWLSFFGCMPVVQHQVVFEEDFDKGRLDQSRWEVTMDGDFAEAAVDVVDVDPGKDIDYRLRLRANTIGMSDPLKFLGVRSRNTIDFDNLKAIKFDLDWNNQINGCYLTASLYLCPTVSSNPREESNWLKFEYVGVPPGRNVRISIWEKVDGAVHTLHTDWGPRDDQGRPLGKPLGLASQRISIHLDKSSIRVVQDNEEIYPSSKHNLNFTTAHIYLQMSSGTNYPSREIYFDNITVRSVSLATQSP
ncbi:hypothetical protein ES703_41580 [subsurface metagenome]